MAKWRIFRHVTKQASPQSLCRRPWWVTSCSICSRWPQANIRTREREEDEEENLIWLIRHTNQIYTNSKSYKPLTLLVTLQTLQKGFSGCRSTGFSGGFSGFFSSRLSRGLSLYFFLCLKTDRQNWPQKCMYVLSSAGIVIMSLGWMISLQREKHRE